MNRAEKTRLFRELHIPGQPLLVPNPWDAGSASILQAMDFNALATTSLGVALTHGVVSAERELLLDNARSICTAVALPITLDYENLFVEGLDDIDEAVALAAATGVVGFSIEDSAGPPGSAVLDFDTALARVAAAVRANQALSVPMVVTARAESMMFGPRNLEEVIRRLRAFEDAGADVLYAPYVRELGQMAQIVSAVSRPVNVVMGFADPTITLAQLADIGVARVSIGAGLCRMALQSFQDSAALMRFGNFNFAGSLRPISTLTAGF